MRTNSWCYSAAEVFVIKAVLLFFILTYVPGLILYQIFAPKFHEYYIYDGAAVYALIVCTLLFVLAYLLIDFLSRQIPVISLPKLPASLVGSLFLFISFLFLISGFYFFLKYDISFRHHNRLSEEGGVVVILFFLRYIALYFLLLCLARTLRYHRLSRGDRISLLMFSLGWLLSINGSFQVFYLFIAFLLLVKPGLFFEARRISFGKIIMLLVLGPLIVALVLFVGIGNKVGVDFLISEDGFIFLAGYISTVAARTSTSLYSLAYVHDQHFSDLVFFSEMVFLELNTLINRLVLIFPIFDFDSQVISTISRYNYLHAFESQAERGGSTPGFLATIFYAGGFPVGFFLGALYLKLIVRAALYHFAGISAGSQIAVLSLSYLILPLFENPLSIINVAQPFFLYVFMVFVMAKFIRI